MNLALNNLQGLICHKTQPTNQGRKEHPLLQFGIVAIEKGAFGSPSTKVANFTLTSVVDCSKTVKGHYNFLIYCREQWMYSKR